MLCAVLGCVLCGFSFNVSFGVGGTASSVVAPRLSAMELPLFALVCFTVGFERLAP